jgi:hypothetical protein
VDRAPRRPAQAQEGEQVVAADAQRQHPAAARPGQERVAQRRHLGGVEHVHGFERGHEFK